MFKVQCSGLIISFVLNSFWFANQPETISNQKFQRRALLACGKYDFQGHRDDWRDDSRKLLRAWELWFLQCFPELCFDFTCFIRSAAWQHHDFAEGKQRGSESFQRNYSHFLFTEFPDDNSDGCYETLECVFVSDVLFSPFSYGTWINSDGLEPDTKQYVYEV